jgi:hypothetical protein
MTANAIGHWAVSFQADDFCSGYSTAQASFDVTPNTYDVSITLNNVPSQYSAQVQVDSQPQGTVGGGEIKKLTFKINTSHTITVDQYVLGDSGVRYYCQQNTASVTSTGSLTFSYQTQYQFTVNTDPSSVTQVSGGGWFPAGTAVQTNQAPETVAGSAGTQYSFKGWEVNGALQSGNPLSLTLDKPYTATAKYASQYQLVVDSSYGNPQGSGFYDAGSVAQFSVTSPVGFLIQQVFVGWQGDFTGNSPQGSVTMDAPKVVHGTWRSDYTQLIIAVGAIAAIVVIAGFLLRRRRQAESPTLKSPPEPTESTEPAGSGTGEPPPAEGSGETVAETSAGSKCGSCGTEVPAGQTFCHNCGGKMN